MLALCLLAACAFCLLRPRPWQEDVRGGAHTLARPPLGLLAGSAASLRGLLDRLARVWRATEEVERLREENRALRETLALREAEAHDATVRVQDLAGFEKFRQTMPAQPIRLVSARVVAADTSPWRHSVILDRGSADGIAIGTPAVCGNSIVGTVVNVRPRAATLRLLSDARAGLKVRIARTGDVGALRGMSARDALLPLPLDEVVDAGRVRHTAPDSGRKGLPKLKWFQLKWVHLNRPALGDKVVTASLDPAIPPGLVAGEVVLVSEAKDHLFYHVWVRPLVDFSRLNEVLLVVYRAPDAAELLEEEKR